MKFSRVSWNFPVDAPESLGMSSERLARLDFAMQRFIDRNQAPGFLTAIVRKGKLVHFQTQGYANVQSQTPLRPDAIFRLYSMTKPITGVAVMMLYEEGHYLLDDPIENFLPEFSGMKVHTENGLVDADGPITIRQLLLHTAGLSYHHYADEPVAKLYDDAGINDGFARLSGLTTKQYVEKLASFPLCFQPGAAWRYSEAMAVLGRLVEVVSGQGFGEFLKERLFIPLGMPDTDFFVPENKQHRLATLYVAADDHELRPATDTLYEPLNSDFSKPPLFESGGAGLVGTAADYLRFAQMLLNGGELEGVRLLSPTSVRLITSNHLGPKYGEKPLACLKNSILDREGLGAGFCGLVVTDAIRWGVGSTGLYSWGGAASTSFWIDPAQDLVGLVLTQLVPDNLYPTNQRMMQMTYQAIVGN